MKKFLCTLLLTTIMLNLTGCRVINFNTFTESNTEELETHNLNIIGKNAYKIDIIEDEKIVNNIKENIQASPEPTTTPELITTNIHSEIEPNKYLSIEEQNKILKKISEFKVTDKASLNELTSIINKNIASFNTRESDLIIKKYILDLYNLMNDLNQILGLIGYQLEYVVSEYNISVNDKSSIQTIPDTYGTVRGFLLEVKDKGFFINSLKENSSYYIDLDLSQILEKYKEYISPSMITYLEFNNYEMNNASNLIIDNEYNLDEIVSRIHALSNGLEQDKNYNYMMAENYASSLVYYYYLLLGLSHNQFYDDVYQFDNVILEKYKILQLENQDNMIGTILEKSILAIETNNYLYDDNMQTMIKEYIDSLIYTDEIKYAINTEQNSEYSVLDGLNFDLPIHNSIGTSMITLKGE